MKVTTTITSGSLTIGERVEGRSVGRTKSGRVAFDSTWSGVFDGVRVDAHDEQGEDYAYFTDGDINGVPQPVHGFPVSHLSGHQEA